MTSGESQSLELSQMFLFCPDEKPNLKGVQAIFDWRASRRSRDCGCRGAGGLLRYHRPTPLRHIYRVPDEQERAVHPRPKDMLGHLLSEGGPHIPSLSSVLNEAPRLETADKETGTDMKKILTAALLATTIGTAAHAGGYVEPVLEPVVIVEDTSSSAGGVLVPLLAIIMIGLALSSSGSPAPAPY